MMTGLWRQIGAEVEISFPRNNMDSSSADDSSLPLDLVGGPFTVIESDPGMFECLHTGRAT